MTNVEKDLKLTQESLLSSNVSLTFMASQECSSVTCSLTRLIHASNMRLAVSSRIYNELRNQMSGTWS
jgi:hypothetical protein